MTKSVNYNLISDHLDFFDKLMCKKENLKNEYIVDLFHVTSIRAGLIITRTI